MAGRASVFCADLARGRGAHALLLARRAGRQRRDAVRGLWRSATSQAALFAVLTVLLWVMHRANIARLLAGTEGKIGRKSAPAD